MKYTVGQKASITKTFSKEDVLLFSELSLDKNPVHLNDEYAKNSIFKQPICHGLLVSSLISAVIANDLPGNGSIYLAQDLQFKKPVYHGDTITAEVTILEIKKEKNIIILNTICTNNNGDIVIEGKAVIKINLV